MGIRSDRRRCHLVARISGLQQILTTTTLSVNQTLPSRSITSNRARNRRGSADGSVRFWLLGDSGTATEMDRDGNPSHPGKAKAVVDSFQHYNSRIDGDQHIDGILLLGDNAYPAGTDAEWQEPFDIYPKHCSAVVMPK